MSTAGQIFATVYGNRLRARCLVDTPEVATMTRPPLTLRVLHTCNGQDHVAALTLKPVKLNSGGTRYEGVRCDGTAIEIFDFDLDKDVP